MERRHWLCRRAAAAILFLAIGLAPIPGVAQGPDTAAEREKAFNDLVKQAAAQGGGGGGGGPAVAGGGAPCGGKMCAGVCLLNVCSDMAAPGTSNLSKRVPSAKVEAANAAVRTARSAAEQAEQQLNAIERDQVALSRDLEAAYRAKDDTKVRQLRDRGEQLRQQYARQQSTMLQTRQQLADAEQTAARVSGEPGAYTNVKL